MNYTDIETIIRSFNSTLQTNIVKVENLDTITKALGGSSFVGLLTIVIGYLYKAYKKCQENKTDQQPHAGQVQHPTENSFIAVPVNQTMQNIRPKTSFKKHKSPPQKHIKFSQI